MRIDSDIDIDFGDRDKLLQLIKYTPAAMRNVNPIRKHATGVYITEVPYDPVNDIASIDYVENNDFEELPKYTITYFSNPMYKDSSYNINIDTYKRLYKEKYTGQFKVFVGMPLVAQKSSFRKGIVKGVHYEVIGIDDKFYTIQKSKDFHTVDDDTPTIKIGITPITEISIKILTKGKNKGKEIKKTEIYNFYEYFTLGFAFSCHKTIGLTIKAPYIVRNNGYRKIDDSYQRVPEYIYVAFSRCIDPKQIFLI
jgi:hypothetical protein